MSCTGCVIEPLANVRTFKQLHQTKVHLFLLSAYHFNFSMGTSQRSSVVTSFLLGNAVMEILFLTKAIARTSKNLEETRYCG